MSFLPKVSIQIPTYNQSETIGLAVQSCLNQTYNNIEINIADDGGSDSTELVLEPFLKDPRVRYFKNKTNIGRVANYRKALFEYATGQWVLNLDGDDYFINNNFIEQAIKDIENAKNDVLFYLGSMKFGSIDNFYFSYPKIASRIKEIKANEYYKKYYEYNHFAHFGFLAQKKYLIQQNLTYSVNISSTDMISFINAAVKYPHLSVILSKDLAAFWVWNGNNYSQNLKFIDLKKNYLALINFNLKLVSDVGVFSVLNWCFWFSFYTWAPYFKHSCIRYGKKILNFK